MRAECETLEGQKAELGVAEEKILLNSQKLCSEMKQVNNTMEGHDKERQ